MRIISLIPARGGSKGIPRKNIAIVDGKPLIYYSISASKQSSLVNRTIVSTDDEEIAEVSRKYGAEVPFIRPSYLAQDNTPTFPVVKHTLEFLLEKENYKPEIIALLEPTFPLRKPEEIDAAIQTFIDDPEADSLRGVCEPFQTPYKMWKMEGKYLRPLLGGDTAGTPRQLLEKIYWQNGYIYLYRYDTIMKKGNLYGDKIIPFVFSGDKFIDVDTKDDIKLVEYMMRNGK